MPKCRKSERVLYLRSRFEVGQDGVIRWRRLVPEAGDRHKAWIAEVVNRQAGRPVVVGEDGKVDVFGLRININAIRASLWGGDEVGVHGAHGACDGEAGHAG